jgi:Tfp pilus assembly protein PilO
MMHKLRALRAELGAMGAFALVLIAGVALLHGLVVAPLQARNAELRTRLAAAAPRADPGAAAASTAQKVGAVYEFLRKEEQTADWLAKLHGIGAATGLQMKSASYRTRDSEGRIQRYEILLPVAGSYGQIRDFLKRSLADIPVLSVDQLTLKREGKTEALIQAEMRLTLHMLKS